MTTFKIKNYRVKELKKDSRLFRRYAKDITKPLYHVTGNNTNIVGTKEFIESLNLN